MGSEALRNMMRPMMFRISCVRKDDVRTIRGFYFRTFSKPQALGEKTALVNLYLIFRPLDN
jgi:hypothetical protein